MNPADGIVAFWHWWATEGADECAGALAAGLPESVAPALAAAVEGIYPELSWELAPGTTSEHRLVVTAAGDPQLRATARRWLRAAPPPDAVWAYTDSRPAEQDMTWTLVVDDHEVSASDVAVSWTEASASLDVVVHHPVLAVLSEQVRDQLAFLLLDHALGETAVETWIGTINSQVSDSASPTSDLGALRAAVEELASRYAQQTWVLMEALTPTGQRLIAAAQRPLRPTTAPHLDQHLQAELPFIEQANGGLPGPRSLQLLREVENQLANQLGDDGRLVAHQTSGGVRTLHIYTDSTTDAADRANALLAGWPEGRPRIRVTPDPGWHAVRHLRG